MNIYAGTPMQTVTTRVNLVYYGTHTPETDRRIIAACPAYAIVNTPHGLWGRLSVTGILQDIPAYQAAGIKVIGYLTGGYETTGSAGRVPRETYSLTANLEKIDDMAKLDRVDGVFIDECSQFPDERSKAYLSRLTTFAHKKKLITWGNVGLARFDPWFFTNGGFDFMHSNEDWNGQNISSVQRAWGNRITVTGQGLYSSPVDAAALTKDAWKKGLAYCYLCAGYTTLPSWLEDYVALLRT